MSELPQVQDEQSLQAWLRVRPGEDAALIAHRAVMRVLPHGLADAGESWAARVGLRSLPNLQLSLSLMVATKIPSPEIAVAVNRANAAVVAAARAASEALQAHPGMTNDRGGFSASVFALAAAAVAAANPATAVEAIAHATAIYTNATHDTIARALYARETATTNLASASAVLVDDNIAFWSAVEFDVHSIIEGRGASDLRLWPDGNPTEHLWAVARAILQQFPGGDFWVDWYQKALDGRPQNWPLLRDVAMIEEALWHEGGEALDRRIGDIRRDHALRATANGEQIEVNPQTGKLRLIPDAQLPEDMASYVRRKMLKAVQVFDGEGGQAYGALAADLTMLRRAVEDAGNLPVELFDACAAATRRLHVRIEAGECPSADQDALIEDYRSRLREAGADILGSDLETRQVLERRAVIADNDALIDAGAAIEEVVQVIEPLLEGRLAEVLPEDAAAATDPATPAEERAAASFRLAGRLLRVEQVLRFGKDIGKGFAAGNSLIAKAGGYLKAIEYLARSPVAKAVKDAVFRWLWS
ncbi:hypothetical protein [uncultured Paracoccus sp.]|uniref:hypothetical protein n=1 Tax=uncultured Paracoccus sp. TaxID=189685 RepID=UPI002609CD7E|nr:hypothetical protein [uncultured Paracoccus sp.]